MVAFDNVSTANSADEVELLDIETNEINHWNHIGGNFHVQQSFGDNHTLAFDYDHLYYHDNNPSSYEMESGFTEITKKTPIIFNIFSLDYNLTLSKDIEGEFGAKTSESSFKNTVEVSSEAGLSSVTQMRERVNALYSSFQFQFGTKTRLTTGLRFEHTSNTLIDAINEDNIHRKYGNLFPNLSIAQKISDGHDIRLSYSKRINRPSFNNLAPFVLFLGPDALYSGNANLQPSLIHKIGMEWGWLGKYLTLEYIIEEDAIAEFQPRLSDTGDQYIFRAENMDKRNMLSLSLNTPLRITSWWHSETIFNYQYESLETLLLDSEFKRTKGTYKITSSQQFSLNPKTSLELSGYYQSPTLFGISTFGARGALNLGIQHKLKKDHGTLSLSLSNVFASDNWKIKTNHSNPNINTLETYLPESRIITLNYTRSFGAKKKKQKSARLSAGEEKKRIQ